MMLLTPLREAEGGLLTPLREAEGGYRNALLSVHQSVCPSVRQ